MSVLPGWEKRSSRPLYFFGGLLLLVIAVLAAAGAEAGVIVLVVFALFFVVGVPCIARSSTLDHGEKGSPKRERVTYFHRTSVTPRHVHHAHPSLAGTQWEANCSCGQWSYIHPTQSYVEKAAAEHELLDTEMVPTKDPEWGSPD